MCGKVLLAVMKAQWGDGGGRILLGDIIGDGAVMLRPIGFLCVGVWFSTELPFIYTHIEFTTYIYIYMPNSDLSKIRLAPDLAEHNYGVSRAVSLSCNTFSQQRILLRLP